MYKIEFLCIVADQMKEHPEWLHDTMKIANSAILARLDEDREINVSIQHSLAMLYDHQFGKQNKKNQIKILEGLMACDALEGSSFLEKIKKKLDEKIDQQSKEDE